jgi:hypothetical protein
MLRRALSAPRAARAATFAAPLAAAAQRGYRVLPHIDQEIEELAETQKAGRWFSGHKPNYCEPMRKFEIMCDKLNNRERRRNGTWHERSIARAFSQHWAKDGKLQEPQYKTKWLTLTVVGYDGHPYHFRLHPLPDVTLNTLIDGSGMNHGWSMLWQKCNNPDCADVTHGDGCLINVDIETLDNLPVPGRFEYYALSHFRSHNRADVRFTARFSCQLKLTADLDGGVFAMKQIYARSLRESAGDWGEDDNVATVGYHKCRKIEPYAPMLEEPTVRDFPITAELLWAQDYEEVMKHKYPNYKRKDGYHTKPETWAAFV